MPRKVIKDTFNQNDAFEMPETSSSRPSRTSGGGKKSKQLDYKSITRSHGCTDIICTIIFILFIAFFIAVSVFAFKYGSPLDLVLPHDQTGRVCGRSPGVEDKKYLLFYDFTKCLNFVSLKGFGCPTEQICVSECPAQNAYEKIPKNKELLAKYCDPFNPSVCPTYLLKSKPIFGRCLPEIVTDISATLSDVITAVDPDSGTSVPIEVGSGSGISQLTIGKLQDAVKYVMNLFESKSLLALAFEDLFVSYRIIGTGYVVGTLLTLIIIILLRHLRKPAVYLTMVLVVASISVLIYFCAEQYLAIKNGSLQDVQSVVFFRIYGSKYLSTIKTAWLVLLIVFSSLLVAILLALFFLRNKIGSTIYWLKEINRAAIEVRLSLVWPVISILLYLAIVALCVTISLFVASTGIKLYKVVQVGGDNSSFSSSVYQEGDYCFPEKFYQTKNQTEDGSLDRLECFFYEFGFNGDLPDTIDLEATSHHFNKFVKIINQYHWWIQGFLIFMCYWMSAFVTCLNRMTLAGGFNSWYWTGFEKKNKKKQRLDELAVSFFRALFLHFGSLALASLLYLPSKIVSVFIEYQGLSHISQRTEAQLSGNSLGCRSAIYGVLLKHLNKYALIATTVHSSIYLPDAANKSYKLIVRAPRLIGIGKMLSFLMLLANLASTAVLGILAFVFFTHLIPNETVNQFSPDHLNFYLLPIVFTIVSAFFMNQLYFDLFTVGSNSVIICVLVELDELSRSNRADRGDPFMGKRFKRLLERDGIIVFHQYLTQSRVN